MPSCSRPFGPARLLPLLVAAAAPPFASAAEPPSGLGEPWTMHHLRDDYLIANSLQPGDVNGDGYEDYAVIDEYLGLQTILLHPGAGGDVRGTWERVVLGQTGNPEYSCLGDLDGDGNPDLVVVEGDDLEKGFETGVRVWWGPTPDRAADPAAWTDGGHLPGTRGEQYLYCLVDDLDGDGRADILVGGRRHPTTRRYAGIRWLTRTGDTDPRAGASWATRFVDSDALSGHGMVLEDVDEDGDPDILLANADWDTPTSDQRLEWYENTAADDAEKAWPRHVIRGDGFAFYKKPQVAVGDLDGDGHDDLATQTQNDVQLYRKTIGDDGAVSFEQTVVPKPDWCQWIGRPIKMADLDGDGSLEVVAALIHLDGLLPGDRASVFEMKREPGAGGPFSSEGWSFAPIKWSDGYNSRHLWRGEKWDHLLFSDVDRDGDLDVVGNVEEHAHGETGVKEESFFSVVWFENPVVP